MASAGRMLLKIVVVIAVLVIVVRLAGWLRFQLRADPAARLAGVPRPDLPEGKDDLRQLLEPIRAKRRVPALAAVLVQGGEIVAIGATGVRRAGGEEPVTIDDRFHLGSDTKAMTATLVAALVGQGKLSWTTTVGEVFGESIPAIDPVWRGVTLEQLLHHRGGAPEDLDADGLWGRLWEREGSPPEQRMQLVEGVVRRAPVLPPGTKPLYSNAGYAIAGAIAERVTGRAWEELMEEDVFAPLGITTAGFGAPGEAEKVDQPWGHRPNGTAIEPGPQADNPAAIGPAGTVHMSIGDWAKFVIAHLRGDPRNPEHDAVLIPAEMYERLHRPIDNYAMGWLVADRAWAKGDRPDDGGIVLTHAGSNTMWFCVAWLAPERDLALLAATNQGGTAAERACDEAVAAMIEAYAERRDGVD